MNNLLRTVNLSKSYTRGRNVVRAVQGVDITIEKGECVAIIGPSGAGKSTLLHMMGGLDRPSSGAVLFEGKDLYRLNDGERSRLRNKRIGFVFQFYNLLSDFTVLENVIMPVLIGGGFAGNKHDMRNRAVSLLKRMELGSRLIHRPSELSGGEAQRVAIARALINEPDVILCDEPTGNLDSHMGAQIYDIIYTISKEKNMSVIIVTHREHDSFQFDRTYFIKDGLMGDPVTLKAERYREKVHN